MTKSTFVLKWQLGCIQPYINMNLVMPPFRHINILFAVVAILMTSVFLHAEDSVYGQLPKTSDLRWLGKLPDLAQLNPRWPKGGAYYCAPTALANFFYWYGKKHHLPRSYFGYHDNSQNLKNTLIETLASQTYLKTNTQDGSTISNILNGLSRFLRDREINTKSLVYQGWKPIPPEYSDGHSQPSLSRIAETIQNNGMVWLAIDWYVNVSEKPLKYEFHHGHMLTLLGYDFTGEVPELIVYDPWHEESDPLAIFVIQVLPLRPGKFVPAPGETQYPDLNLDSSGYFRLQLKGRKFDDKKKFAVLDGVLMLELENP